jgi:hypothetical protein
LTFKSITRSQITSNLLSLTAPIRNDGAITSQVTVVEFRRDSAMGTNLFSQSITSLAPGEAVDVSFVWDVLGLAGNLDVFAVVDATNRLNEFDRQNNWTRLAIQRASGPVNLRLGPLVRLSGGVFQITVLDETGRNYEVQASTNFQVQIEAGLRLASSQTIESAARWRFEAAGN